MNRQKARQKFIGVAIGKASQSASHKTHTIK